MKTLNIVLITTYFQIKELINSALILYWMTPQNSIFSFTKEH
jgi:hypothetical protein